MHLLPVRSVLTPPDRLGVRFPRTPLALFCLWIAFATATGFAAPGAPGTTAASVAVSQRRVIRVGAPNDSYPYSYLDEQGHLTGFSVDILDAVARVMGLNVEREAATGLDINRRFGGGEFDVNQLLSVTPDRAKYAGFSVPYLVLNGAIYARRDDHRIKSLDDLRRLHVTVVTAGGPAYDFAIAQGLAPDQLRTRSTEDAMRDVADGRADVALVSRLTGLAQIHRLHIKNVAPVGPQIGEFPAHFCFAVHRDNDELLAEINEGLAVLHQTGEYDSIYRQWFSRYEPVAFTRNEFIASVAAGLAIALIVALWSLRRQRQLSRRIALQAAELTENRALLAEAQRFATIGHWQLLQSDPDGLSCSDETFRILGRDPHVVGRPKTIEDLLAWAGGPDIARWRDAIARCSNDGTPYDLDLTIEPRPGRRAVIHTRGRVVRNSVAVPAGQFGTIQDITARRDAEVALRRSERLLRAFYDNLPHAVGVAERTTTDWQIVSLNRGAISYFTLTKMPPLPVPLAQLGLETDREHEWRRLLDSAAASPVPIKTESRSHDRRREYAVTLVPLGAEIQPIQCYFLVEDVTERKAKDAEIAQGRRLRALGSLVGGIAHEFNNLLTPILMKADELRYDASDPQLREGLTLISETARRSAELTGRLLAFGRNRTQKPEEFSLSSLVDNCLALVRQTTDRRIQIECDIRSDLPRLYLCSNDVHQILLNLVLNARDTLLEKLGGNPRPDWQPMIRIEAQTHPAGAFEPATEVAQRAESWIALTVRDNGMGMPAGVIERVFEPFYTTKEVGRGTGLGLATVWHLMTELGGRIYVESAAGEGSSFRLALPVYPARPMAPAPSAAAGAAPPVPSGLRLLVVEDETVISKMLASLLQRQGHQIALMRHGQEAWDKLAAAPHAFDALIVDLNLPGMSGVELTRRARAMAFERPILVMSGHITLADRQELERLRVTAILLKPFTVEEFTAMLARLGQSGRTAET